MTTPGRWQCPSCSAFFTDCAHAYRHQLAARHKCAEWLPRRRPPQRIGWPS